MFKQIHAAFQHGLEEQVAKPLQANFSSMRSEFLSQLSNNPAVANTQAAPATTPIQHTALLLSQGNVADALQYALSQGDMECVMHVCRNGDIAVLDQGGVEQKVVCSLIQQLDCDIENELEIKMEWLQAAVLVLDDQNQTTKALLPTLLDSLTKSLESVFQVHSSRTDPLHNSIKLMMHLVSSKRKGQ